ncbi:hypothetical protein [Candidatus Electrothrix sp.]|uniref:hypothetical protein n=1 Tax=Candidatus Electrothrix sp. TaxID=2170559 RepID=UPI00405653B0
MHDQHLDKRFNLLTVSKHLFHLQAETSLRLPPYKGSAFHGAAIPEPLSNAEIA